MTIEWTYHTPAFGGDEPRNANVSLDTHYVECRPLSCGVDWEPIHSAINWSNYVDGKKVYYRYRMRPITYEQVCAWHIANGSPVPPKPINYEAWQPVIEAYLQDTIDDPSEWTAMIGDFIAAMRLAMTIPACREVIE